MINIKANFDEGAEVVESIGKQLPFAVAKTLTKLAEAGKAAGIAEEKSGIFTLRNDWTERGTRITPATKESQFAEVYTDTSNWQTKAPDYLARQEDGAERVPVGKRTHIAIPEDGLWKLLGGKNKPIPDWARPKAMLEYADRNGKYVIKRGKLEGQERRAPVPVREMYFFKVQVKSGAYAIFARHVADRRDAIYLMFMLVTRAHIRKRFHLEEDVLHVVEEQLPRVWSETMQNIFPLTI